MMKMAAFELVDAEPLQNEKWLARGRAWVDIAIGDSLFLEVFDNNGVKEYAELKVEYITTYRRELPLLNSGLTGSLTLSGEQGIRLREVEKININKTYLLLYKNE